MFPEKKPKKPPYVDTPMLRKGQRVMNTVTGEGGVVDRAITSKRYVINYGKDRRIERVEVLVGGSMA